MEPEEVTESLVKQHETVIYINLRRSIKHGLRVTVKAHPAVEELVRSWGDGSVVPSVSFGRHWHPSSDGAPLNVYSLGKNTGYIPFESSSFYRLDRVGAPLIEQSGDVPSGSSTNLSFLRLVGVSEGAGVSFYIRGVHTLENMKKMSDAIKVASRAFYINFMRPVDITVRVSTEGVNF